MYFYVLYCNIIKANHWLHPSKYLLVLKTSLRRLQDMSWGRLQHVFSVTILRLPRRLKDVLKTSSKRLGRRNCYAEGVFKTSWRHVLKTTWRHVLTRSWRHVLKTSWRHYGDKQNTYWKYLYLTNLNVYLTNLHFTNLHLTILRRIQNALIRTHHFNIRLILELKQHLYFKDQNLWWLVLWNQLNSYFRKGQGIITNF